MTNSPDEAGVVPEWTMGDRLRKARARTGLTVKGFADRIGVSEKTINNAEGDKRAVRKITLNAWAYETGVNRRWLETGQGPTTPGGPDGVGQTTQRTRLQQLADEKRARRAGDPATHRYLLAA